MIIMTKKDILTRITTDFHYVKNNTSEILQKIGMWFSYEE